MAAFGAARLGQADLEVIVVRPARPDEAPALSALALRSKAHWGYDADFLARCRLVLTVSPRVIDAGQVFVAEDHARVLGLCALDDRDAELKVDLLYVEPTAIGSGAGRALWSHAVSRARQLGLLSLSVVADPNAEGFYLRMGAARIGTVPSEVDPGRNLPLLRLAIA
jgi:GNAT superfamily N-acetyltransferase